MPNTKINVFPLIDHTTVAGNEYIALSSGDGSTNETIIISELQQAPYTNQTASTVPYFNSSTELTSSAVTPTELGYLSGVTSAIQTQFAGKSATTGNAAIATVGTVTAGTWHATVIAPTYGGTGADLHTATMGDIVTFGAAGVMADSGVLLTSLAPKASPTFTGAATAPTAIVQKLELAPVATEAWGAAVTIDVTKTSHNIAASFTTSATATYNASAAGTAGDLLLIITEADGSGTGTVTFGTHFRSSGTQATLMSTASSATFMSDGTNWIELCRTTAIT